MQLSPIKTEERVKLDIKPGDTVRVWQRIQEEKKSRLQAFEGLVIARKHGTEPGATFTVRKTAKAGGVGVEMILPLYSPKIEKIELVSRPKRVRRAKLYYLRERAARAIRKKMKQSKQMGEVMMDTQKVSPKTDEEIKEAEAKAKAELKEEKVKAEEVKETAKEAKKEDAPKED
ncbi:MAG: 50S ribosomal protein L19 [Candidatus Marinimicrobia bacterium]|nr:50S ribosomal protein L19 [Candidatus Neomarinimicrobiota bacterium]